MNRALLLLMAVPALLAAADAPTGYALRLALTPATGGSLQRVDLPARVLVASRVADLADVRVFDAAGRAMPTALSRFAGAPARRTVALAPLPILGAQGALSAPNVTLTLDAGAGGTVRVEGARAAADRERPLGALFDTRAAAPGVADRLTLTAVVLRGRPTVLTLESSDTLRDWTGVAEATAYSATGAPVTVALPFAPRTLHGRFLRVTWPADTTVAVREATLAVTAPPSPATFPRALVRPATADDRAITLALPFAGPVTALEIGVPGEADAVIPVRIFARASDEQPWRPLVSGSVYRVTSGGEVRRNPPFAIANTTDRYFRIEADARGAGFTRTPDVAVRLPPARLLFLAGGRAPYTLTAGQTAATSAHLAPDALVPGYGPDVEARLPRATISAAPDPVVGAATESRSRRGVVLWGVLLAGTALLALMVWRLMRSGTGAKA